MITAKQKELIGLQPQEKKVLSALKVSDTGLTVTAISSLINEPRTTTGFYLNKLLKKGWATKMRNQGSPYPLWYIADKSEIGEVASKFFTDLGIHSPSLSDPSIVNKGNGYEQVVTAYEETLRVSKTGRIFVIQGIRAPLAMLKNVPSEIIEKIQTIQKQKPIILEGITSPKVLLIFKNMSLQELRSHHGRLTVVYLIPDEYLDFDAEFFILKDKIVIIRPQAAKTFVIEDKEIVRALNMITSFIEKHAQKININEHIKKLIEEKTNSRGKGGGRV